MSGNLPLVSVLMTAYNREQYISEAIESVLASTYNNFELIIVDDASTDKTAEIAFSYTKDSRVKVYVNEKNIQQFQNRNKAASYATGKYLKYVDSDDIIYPHSLMLMVNIMESFSDCGMGFCHTSGNSKWPLPHNYTSKEIYREHYFGGGILFTGPVGTIIRKDVFDMVGGFELYGMPSDNHFSLKVAARFPVVSMYRDMIWWRSHADQAFTGQTDDINIFNNFKWNSNILSDPACPLDEHDRLKAIRNFKKIFARNIIKRMIKSPQKIFKLNKMLQQYKKGVL
jgi:glycosyltransferase involved in cell wall biosynthesis